ncbi:MAG: hypothetical protein PHW10_05235 [Candidatus Peribacteraceae bacterium]|nr:hypothetical protein [Candidatus Peribacteraceae bacterium]
MNNTLSPAGFPRTFSDMVVAAAERISLTDGEKDAFLAQATLVVMDAFWRNYAGELPQAAQEELERAVQSDDFQSLESWKATHADFLHDPSAEKRGRAVLKSIHAQLPSYLKKVYESSSSDHA